MTASQLDLAAGLPRPSRRLLTRLSGPALGALLWVLLAGAWLAFFLYVPFDFTLSHVA